MNFFKFLFAATMATTTPENPFKGSVEYQESDSEKLLTFNFENVPTAAIATNDKIEIAFPDEGNTDLRGATLALADWGNPDLSANKITLTSEANDGAWPQQLEFNLQDLTQALPRYSSKSQFTITLTPVTGPQNTTSIDLPKELKFGGSVEYKEADDQLTFKFSDQAELAEPTNKIDIVFPGELSGTAELAENSDWTISNSKKTISLERKNGATSKWPGELSITGAIGETRFDSESHITITFEDDAPGSLETLTIDVPETLVKETPSGSKGSSLSVLSLALLLVA